MYSKKSVCIHVLVGGSVLRIGYLHGSLTFARAHSEDTDGECCRFPTAIAVTLKPPSRTETRNARRLIIKVKWGKNRSSENTIKAP